ncbi:Barrier-to-autointegration factor [Fukomys damarensis]|uniref:Barrier-to-autointegration factor n=1 Tax=Fukomys damarensis TaxID=885580 RepID=A0A091D8C6_FUKDA|nr:Barrier-to-autointegration factor [Fukomys damarensis]
MTTSQKHRDFVAEPMGEKPVGSLAGIGEVLGKKLEERGFDKAYVVLGQFLVLKKDEDLFREWLKDTCGANAKQSRDCFGCLREWGGPCLLYSLPVQTETGSFPLPEGSRPNHVGRCLGVTQSLNNVGECGLISSGSQLVAGVKYYLTMDLESTACRKTRVSGDHMDLTTCPLATGVEQEKLRCDFEILEVPWKNSTELLKHKCMQQ